MMPPKIEDSLNEQIKLEVIASMQYLAMASWSEVNGYNGIAAFFYRQSDEERMHMLKIIKFINERGGHAQIPSLEKVLDKFESLNHLFNTFLEGEQKVTAHVQEIVHSSLKLKAYAVHNFMQWFVAEQVEEEALANTMLDRLKIIGDDKGGLYLFDRDLETLTSEEGA